MCFLPHTQVACGKPDKKISITINLELPSDKQVLVTWETAFASFLHTVKDREFLVHELGTKMLT